MRFFPVYQQVSVRQRFQKIVNDTARFFLVGFTSLVNITFLIFIFISVVATAGLWDFVAADCDQVTVAVKNGSPNLTRQVHRTQ